MSDDPELDARIEARAQELADERAAAAGELPNVQVDWQHGTLTGLAQAAVPSALYWLVLDTSASSHGHHFDPLVPLAILAALVLGFVALTWVDVPGRTGRATHWGWMVPLSGVGAVGGFLAGFVVWTLAGTVAFAAAVITSSYEYAGLGLPFAPLAGAVMGLSAGGARAAYVLSRANSVKAGASVSTPVDMGASVAGGLLGASPVLLLMLISAL